MTITRFCLAISMALAISHDSLQAQSAPAKTDVDVPVNIVDKQVPELIAALDSRSFRQREQATADLIALGSVAFEPIVRHALDASPESTRRIKICLEQISTQGDESTFYKGVALLSVLFGNGSPETEARIVQLQKEWAVKQTQQTIADLTKLGAKFGQLNSQEQLDQMLIINNVWIEQPTAEPVREKIVLPRRKLPSRSEAKKLIDEILVASVSENRERVHGSRTMPSKNNPGTSGNPVVNELDRQMRLLENGVNVVRIGGLPMQHQGISVTFGPEWSGSESDFKRLNQVENLTSVSFQKHKIDQLTLNILAELPSLNDLGFENCRIANDAVADIGLPDKVTSVRFTRQKIDGDLIEHIGTPSRIRALNFDSCIFSKAAVSGLAKCTSLMQLEFHGTRIDKEVFDILEKMEQLSILRLSTCKFALNDFDTFRRSRRDVNVETVAKAFLGVRSDTTNRINEEELGCVISHVVEDSGAEAGGVLVGDRIAAINDNKIERFEDLRVCMSQHKPGDQITIEVERNSEMIKLTVQLGNIDDVPTF